MAYQVPADVEALIKQRMALGAYASEDDVLRDALESLELREQERPAPGMNETTWRSSRATKGFRGPLIISRSCRGCGQTRQRRNP